MILAFDGFTSFMKNQIQFSAAASQCSVIHGISVTIQHDVI